MTILACCMTHWPALGFVLVGITIGAGAILSALNWHVDKTIQEEVNE